RGLPVWFRTGGPIRPNHVRHQEVSQGPMIETLCLVLGRERREFALWSRQLRSGRCWRGEAIESAAGLGLRLRCHRRGGSMDDPASRIVRYKDFSSDIYKDARRPRESAFADSVEYGPARPGHVVDPHDALIAQIRHKNLTHGVHKNARGRPVPMINATYGMCVKRSPTGSLHVVDTNEAMVARIRHKDLPSCAHEDAFRLDELVDPAAAAAECGPTTASHIVDAHNAVIARVRHKDLAGGVHRDTRQPFELANPVAAGAERRPAAPGHAVEAHEAIDICHEDLTGGGYEDAVRKGKLVHSSPAAAKRGPPGPDHVVNEHDPGVPSIRHKDLPGRVHENACGSSKLIDAITRGAERVPVCSGWTSRIARIA